MGRFDLGNFEYKGVSVCEVIPTSIAIYLGPVQRQVRDLDRFLG